MQESDFRWMWAAYRLGGFDSWLGSGMNREEFTRMMLECLERVSHDWILEAPNEKAPKHLRAPVGLIMATGDQRIIEPHVEWFPWATKRNRIETTLTFLNKAAKNWKIMIYARQEHQKFFVHMCKYGQLTSGCKILDYYALDEHGYFFYTRGP